MSSLWNTPPIHNAMHSFVHLLLLYPIPPCPSNSFPVYLPACVSLLTHAFSLRFSSYILHHLVHPLLLLTYSRSPALRNPFRHTWHPPLANKGQRTATERRFAVSAFSFRSLAIIIIINKNNTSIMFKVPRQYHDPDCIFIDRPCMHSPMMIMMMMRIEASLELD